MILALFLPLLFACSPEPPVQDAGVPEAESGENLEASQQYPLRGVVTAVDSQTGALTIDHEAIGDWMGAMKMSFPVRGMDPEALPKVGDSVTANVNVDGHEFWLTDVSSGGMSNDDMMMDHDSMEPGMEMDPDHDMNADPGS